MLSLGSFKFKLGALFALAGHWIVKWHQDDDLVPEQQCGDSKLDVLVAVRKRLVIEDGAVLCLRFSVANHLEVVRQLRCSDRCRPNAGSAPAGPCRFR